MNLTAHATCKAHWHSKYVIYSFKLESIELNEHATSQLLQRCNAQRMLTVSENLLGVFHMAAVICCWLKMVNAQ